ncbi:MAG: DUF1273 family protein [Christensenellaceae bacterium]|nr:DUF1273 family protein [Christensenellaceae bacterium]
MREKTVCFAGYSIIPHQDYPKVKARLEAAIIDLISKGYTDFVAGGDIGFHTFAAQTVLRLKKDYTEIKLHLVLPARNYMDGWSKAVIASHQKILQNADEVEYISDKCKRSSIRRRNQRLVDMSSACICFLLKRTGGAAYTVRYARTKKLQIISII